MRADLTVSYTQALAGPVTQPGYLVELGFSTVLRLSTAGDVTWDGKTWVDADVRVDGLSAGESGQAAASLTLGNADGAFGVLLMSQTAIDIPVRIWSRSGGSSALEFSGVIDGAEIGLECRLPLLPVSSVFGTAPRRVIGPSSGFNALIPAGSRIVMGTQTYVLERA